MEEPIITLTRDTRFTGIYLYQKEIDILHHLYEFKILPTENLHRILKRRGLHVRSRKATTKRLSKFVDAGLLFLMSDSSRAGRKYGTVNFHYRLGSRGYDVLFEQNLITETEYHAGKEIMRKTALPTLHNKAIGDIYAHLYELLESKGKTFRDVNTSLARGDRSILIKQANQLTTMKTLIPDFVFDTPDHTICIEVDSGAQPPQVLEEKYARYKQLAKMSLKPIVLVFSVGLFIENGKTNRSRRVVSVKQTFPNFTEWGEQLDIYVVPTSRAALLLEQLIHEMPIDESWYRQGKIMSWIKKSNQITPENCHFSRNREGIFDSLIYSDPFDIDAMLSVGLPDEHSFRSGMIYMDMGSVKSYQRARMNVYRIQDWNRRRSNEQKPTYLLLIFKDELGMIEDPLGLDPLCRLFKSNVDQLEQVLAEESANFPPLLELLSYYQQKETDFYDKAY